MDNFEFTPLSKILVKTVNQYNLHRQVQGALVCHHFRKLAVELWHDSIEETVRGQSFKEGILMVIVSDSGWAQQVQFKRVEILEQLKIRCPKEGIKDLRLRVVTF